MKTNDDTYIYRNNAEVC